MSRFTPLLKDLNERLDLPQPKKSRIILEIAADLEDLYQFYLNHGLNEKEAAQKAEEKINLTDEALDELVRIHQSLFRKLIDKITEQAQTRWEKIIFVLILLFIAAISTKAIFSSQFLLQASKLVLPVLGLFLGVVLISIPKFYQLYIKRDHHIKKLHNGLTTILVLGVINLFIGIFGYFKELYSAGSSALLFVIHLGYIVTIEQTDSEQTLSNITEWMIKSSSLIIICLLVTIFTALIWYTLMNKVMKIEQAEASVLLHD